MVAFLELQAVVAVVVCFPVKNRGNRWLWKGCQVSLKYCLRSPDWRREYLHQAVRLAVRLAERKLERDRAW
jgi:hypothetical protein